MQEATSQPAVKYEAVVQENGRVDIAVPFAPGKRVIVFIIQDNEDQEIANDLSQAAASSLTFWDNSFDDEDWNA